VDRQHTPDIPIKDPSPRLSPTANRILEAARRILERDGFPALTFENIAAESGENRASIRYHFGNKAGLLAALVDAIIYHGSVALIEAASSEPAGERRQRALIDMQRQMAVDVDDYRTFFDIIPYVLRDEALKPRFAELYEWYRALDRWALAPQDTAAALAAVEHLATLTVAMLDGLALQVQADPGFDIKPAMDLWATMVREHLGRV
jgi:AcrR family transcriptional regulator